MCSAHTPSVNASHSSWFDTTPIYLKPIIYAKRTISISAKRRYSMRRNRFLRQTALPHPRIIQKWNGFIFILIVWFVTNETHQWFSLLVSSLPSPKPYFFTPFQRGSIIFKSKWKRIKKNVVSKYSTSL